MVQSDWRPMVDEGPAPLWSRLVDTLAADIAAGRLRAGMRLPPHRQLAFMLGVAVGTISRAYAEAERRGLVESHVGRGTYVADRRPIPLAHRQSEGRINLGMNIPPIGPALGVMDETLEKLRQRGDLSAMFDYTQTAGLPVVREAGARWLKEQAGVARASADRLIQTNGGQQALMLACSSVVRSGDIVLCDSATYPGNRTIAEHGGWLLQRVPGDAEGMDPAELDRIAGQTGARLVILIPTLHNPTTVTMSEERRSRIVEVARKRDLILIEDDIY
ncbi:MAG TPA: PLP-dependent aminotransferase family protein, partial [Devosia sp.]|nr:PLP-dependent aminotransferase family protein [Devosia sp.]